MRESPEPVTLAATGLADQPWASLIRLPSQMTERTLLATLTQAGWCEFELGLTVPGVDTPQSLFCRAVLAQDHDGTHLKLDGVGSLQIKHHAEQTPSDGPHPRLSEMAFATITMTPTGVVTGWHSALSRSLGITGAEAIGQDIKDLVTFHGLMPMPRTSFLATFRGFLNGETAVAATAGKRIVLQRVMRRVGNIEDLVLVTVTASGADGGHAVSNPPEIEEIADPVLLVDRETFRVVRASLGAQRRLLHPGRARLPLPLDAFSEDLTSELIAQELYLANGATVHARCHITDGEGGLSTAIAQVRAEPHDPLLYVALRAIRPAQPG